MRPVESISAETPASLSASSRRSGGSATRTGPDLQRAPLARRLLDGPGFVALRVGVDLLMVTCAVLAAIIGAHSAGISTDGEAWLYAFPFLVVFFLHLRGMYRQKVIIQVLDDVAPVVGAISVAAMAVLTWQVGVTATPRPVPQIGRIWFFTVLLLGARARLLALSAAPGALARAASAARR